MLRSFLIVISVFCISMAAIAQPYDEYADSPTVEVEGCGVFPAVRVYVDGQETENRGFIRNGHVFMAARETLERLGSTVTWVQSQRAFYAQYPQKNRTVRVTVGSPAVRIYQHDQDSRYGAGRLIETITLNASPFICGGRMYAPMRAAVESAGGSVQYDRNTRSVHVYLPESAD